MKPFQRIHVRVPASTSNLGPGFDALGLALELATTVTVTPADTLRVTVSGEGAAQLSCGPDNLICQTIARMLGQPELPAMHLHIENGIPLERGLGASGAACLAGLLIGNALLDEPLDRAELLQRAYEIEGHPDNVTPSLLGGCTLSASDNGSLTTLPVPFPDDLVVALCIPNARMPTAEARELMPQQYPQSAAVFNLSRTALLVAALVTRQYDALQVAVQDRLHQPYRAQMFPALLPMITAAHAAGAYGAFLSGAGSTVAAFTRPECAALVAQAMANVGADYALVCRAQIIGIDRAGAVLTVQRQVVGSTTE